MRFYLIAACALLATTSAFAGEPSKEDIYLENIKTVMTSPQFGAYKKARGIGETNATLYGSEFSPVTDHEAHHLNSPATHLALFRYRAGRNECVIIFPVQVDEKSGKMTIYDGFSDGGCGE